MIDSLTSEAIASLQSTLIALLSSVDHETVQRQLTVIPVRTRPIGVGGHLSVHPDPAGLVEGRCLEAIALIHLQAQAVTALNEGAAALAAMLVGQRRSDLLHQGIVSLNLENFGTLIPPHPPESGTGVHRELRFQIVYEFRKVPTESEGIIQTVPIHVAVE